MEKPQNIAIEELSQNQLAEQPADSAVQYSRYFIEFAYKGTNYHGWQQQPNANTVQAELDRVLAVVFKQPIVTIGAGRTDTGVHARQMYAHFDAYIPSAGFRFAVRRGEKSDIPELPVSDDISIQTEKLIYSMNMMLPPDIAVKSLLVVAPDAHARFNATQRSYEYHIHFEKDPFIKEFAHYVHPIPDIKAMNAAAKLLLEYIDYTCFMKSMAQTNTNNCTVTRAEWLEVPGGMVFHVSANRFLRNMVRAMVGTLLQVGHGKLTVEGFRQVIESKSRCEAGVSVPACGLYLTSIVYPYI
jgi:tRNA pseudouridine38-40 synthase